jgi:hypothetical protein
MNLRTSGRGHGRHPSRATARTFVVVAMLSAATACVATLSVATPASAVVVPPPAQGVKMIDEPGSPSYGQATAVNQVADDATHDWYPAGPGSSNSEAYVNYVIRTGTGSYEVWLPGLGAFGAATVTAAPDVNCVVSRVVAVTWDVPGTDVVVTCVAGIGFTSATSPGATIDAGADATFTLEYAYFGPGIGGSLLGPGAPHAYLNANQPREHRYVPDLRYQYNVAGEPNTVERVNPGQYLVRLPGVLTPGQGPTAAHVTAYGPSGHRCHITDEVASQLARTVSVACQAIGGALADAAFVLTYGEAVAEPRG